MSKLVRFGTLGLLYFVQGAPYGFQTACLPLILRQNGLSFTELGVMKLLFLPWICKPLYSPIISNTKSKKWWLLLSISLLGLTCLMAGFLVSVDNLVAMSALLFVFNFLASAQDISVDSLAIQALSADELGAGNTIQVVGYKLGSIFAGSFLLWIEGLIGWTGMFLSFASVYCITVILVVRLQLVERSGGSKHDTDDQSIGSGLFLASLKVPGTFWMISFVLFYKLCERAELTFSLFMVDKNVPMNIMAFWSSVIKGASILGSAYGGWALSSKFNTSPKTLLVRFVTLRSLCILLQLWIISHWAQATPLKDGIMSNQETIFVYSSFLILGVTLFSAGVLTTATFTMMMRLSQLAPDNLQGTHYTMLATSEILGKLMFAVVAGWLTDVLGLQTMFFIFFILAILNVPLVLTTPGFLSNLSKPEKKE